MLLVVRDALMPAVLFVWCSPDCRCLISGGAECADLAGAKALFLEHEVDGQGHERIFERIFRVGKEDVVFGFVSVVRLVQPHREGQACKRVALGEKVRGCDAPEAFAPVHPSEVVATPRALYPRREREVGLEALHKVAGLMPLPIRALNFLVLGVGHGAMY